MRKATGLILMSLVVFSLSAAMVSAYALGTPYGKGAPLEMYSGESKDITLDLQNLVGGDDYSFVIEMTSEEDVAILVDAEHTLRVGERVDVLLNVRIPKDAEIGKIYSVNLIVKPTPVANEGQVIAVGSSIKQSFDVVVVEQPPEQKPTILGTSGLLAGLIVIILLIVLWVLIIYLKKKKIF